MVVGVTLGLLHLPEVGFAKMGLFTHVQWQFCHCCEFSVNGSTIGCKLLSSWLFPPWLSNLCFLWPDKKLIDLHHGMSHPSPGMHHAGAHSHPRTFCMVLVVKPCHAIPLRVVHVAHSFYSCSCDIFVDVVENFGIHPVKVRKWVLSRLSLIQLSFQCNWIFVSECSWARSSRNYCVKYTRQNHQQSRKEFCTCEWWHQHVGQGFLWCRRRKKKKWKNCFFSVSEQSYRSCNSGNMKLRSSHIASKWNYLELCPKTWCMTCFVPVQSEKGKNGTNSCL